MSDLESRSDISEKGKNSGSGTDEEVPIAFIKKKKRARYDFQEEDSENIIDQLIQSMREAAVQDVEANKSGLPALSKLKMLDRVIKFLKLSKFHDLFLEMNGCVVLGMWLNVLPDGSFPSNPLRKGLLEILQDLQIEVDHLSSSELGKAVMTIYKNPNEAASIKKLAKNLIDKWSRKIYGIQTEYTQFNADKQLVDPSTVDKKKVNLQSLIENEKNSIRIPEKGMFNFRAIPSSVLNETEKNDPNSTYSRLKKKMTKKTAKKSKSLMSVDGKGLDY